MNQHKKHVGVTVHKRGATFRVWAPFADEVSVGVDLNGFQNWDKTPMENEGDGYWSAQVRKAEPGQEYKFFIKNGDQYLEKNDPRAYQLTSTNGTSVIPDFKFKWSDKTFELPPKDEMVIYEMHIGSFARKDQSTEGTFYDAIEKLDHLANLGINMIEIMPLGSMYDDHGWGYNPEYIYSVEGAYGGRHGLLEFVNQAHKRGIGVILDLVYNHFCTEPDTAIWRFDGWYENDGGGIYFYNDWRGDTPWGPRPDFGRQEVRQFFLDNIRYWINDCHIDGYRLDSTLYTRNVHGDHNNPGTDLPEAWRLFQEINDLAKKILPQSITIAEDIGYNEYITKDTSEGGANFDAQWEVTMPYAFREAIINEHPNLSILLGLIPRTYNGIHLESVNFVDSHDSAANGAARLNHQIDPRNPQSELAQHKSLLAATVMFATPGIPMLLQGQEFLQGSAFEDWHELDWSLVESHHDFVGHFKDLIQLRKTKAPLKSGNINIIHVDDDNSVIAIHRWDDENQQHIVVVANFGENEYESYDLGMPIDGEWSLLYSNHTDLPESVVSDTGRATIHIPKYSAGILELTATDAQK